LPEHAGEDSISFLPLLKDPDQPVRTHAVSCACDGTPSVRQGPWKLVLAADEQAQTPVQLYHLGSDLGETKNVAAAQPKLVAELRALMEQWIVAGRTTPGERQKNDIKVRRYPRANAAAQKARAK
jgi:hypothetical protein